MTDKDKTIVFWHLVYRFNFTALGRKNKWMAYKFTKNIHNKFIQVYYKFIYSALNNLLSGLDFEIVLVAICLIPYLRKSFLLKSKDCYQ